MEKNKKRSIERQADSKPKKQDNKIKFSFNSKDIQCFISPKDLTKSKSINNHPDKANKKIVISKQPKWPTIDNKNRSLSKIDSTHRIFNNKLLVMHYDQDEMYIDSARKVSQNKSSKSKQKPQSTDSDGDQVQNQILTSCIKVITEQTDNSSNNPLSARYGLQLPPEAYQSYDLNYYMDHSARVRNKRTVTQQQSCMYQVDIANIQKDGRTTLMMRNIPNKYTRDMILEELDSLNFKKKNQCNVGYAFINFIHTKFISQFYQQFHEKKWSKFNSEKICQVCYARIQGTAQLMNHFKNSNVIQQKDKKLRPIIQVNPNLIQMVQRQKNQTNKQLSA